MNLYTPKTGRLVRLGVLLTVVFVVSYFFVVSYHSPRASSSSSSVSNSNVHAAAEARLSQDRLGNGAGNNLPGPPQSKGGNSRPAPKHTIAVNFKGRIGNLMFMYASLLGIAEANNLRPVIPEHLELLNFFDFTTEKVKDYGRGRKLYREKSGLHYEPEAMKLGGDQDVILDGYFQSWRYFKDIEPRLRKELTFKRDIRDRAQRQIDDVTRGKCHAPPGEGCVYIGVHVRRGDMVHVKKFVDYGYISADKDYLDKALDHYRSKFPKRAVFVVLSDDQAWCQKNLGGGEDVGVVQSGNPPYLDLAILGGLNHTAMTVGSYGWWGAWLAGGDTLYWKGYPRPGSTLHRLMNQSDYRYPGSIPL